MTRQNRKISLDFEAVFSPYTFASALAGLHSGAIQEICIPETFQFIELWNTPVLPHPITLALERDDEKIFLDASRRFGFSTDVVDPSDPFAGLLLLRKAIKAGVVTFMDPTSDHRDVVETYAQKKRLQ